MGRGKSPSHGDAFLFRWKKERIGGHESLKKKVEKGWREFHIRGEGRVELSLEISRDGLIKGIWVKEMSGSPSLVRGVIQILKEGEPYREVMKDLSGSMTFELVFVVNEGGER